MKLDAPKNVNYSATVVRINTIIEFPGLDNLVGIPILGHQALTTKGKEVGQWMIAFTAETQLSEEYARENDLFRDADLNKGDDKGYLEQNGRIRAIKLRGHVSNALLMPLSSVEYTGVEWWHLREGDTFDHVMGHEICRKYELPVKQGSQPGSKVEKAFRRVTTKVFPEHLSTDQYGRSKHLLVPLRETVVSQKLHGCFPSKTLVTLADGTQRRINAITSGDMVLGLDHSTGSVVASRVIASAATGRAEKWLATKIDYPLKGQSALLVSTPEHQFYTENRGYVDAVDLNPEDRLVFERTYPRISCAKMDILEGMLLGDGSFANTGGNYGVEWSCKEDHLSALEHRARLLGSLCRDGRNHRTSGYGTPMIGAGTIRHPVINEMADRWRYIPRVGKTVPDDLALSDITVATFYADDGSLSHNKQQYQRDRAAFAICDWDDESADRIRNAFIAWGMKNPVVYKSGGYNRMRLNADDAYVMFARIAPLLPPVMAYKLPAEYRHLAQGLLSLEDDFCPLTVSAQPVHNHWRSAEDFGYSTKYDIQTETGNFFANRILVHNSSIRVGRVPAIRALRFRDRLARRLGVPVPEYEYAAVYGSRKVIKDPAVIQNNYYDSDIWTLAGEKIAELVPEGYVLYGELIGFTPNGDPIQKNYTYHLAPGECELYVYRVAHVNRHGDLADLSWDGVKEFCTARGLKWVPELARFNYLPYMEEWLEAHQDVRFTDYDSQFYIDAALPLSHAKTVDEGVCIRQEGLTPLILKNKSQEFLRHETLMLDAGEVDLESVG